MWLSKKIKSSSNDDRVESGSITLSGSNIEAESSVNVRSVSGYSPYGYSYVPPVGEEAVLIPSADGRAMLGTRLNAIGLEEGEIKISSKGGATIVLKNDGTVVINSLIISKEGKIEQ